MPYDLNSVTMIFDTTPTYLADADTGNFLLRDRRSLPHQRSDEYLFDNGTHNRREFTVQGRTFIVSLLAIRKLTTPHVANPIEYEFSISEK
jgi:hypothetical protein